MDREVSKEQQTRHIHDGTLMRCNIRAYSNLTLQTCRMQLPLSGVIGSGVHKNLAIGRDRAVET